MGNKIITGPKKNDVKIVSSNPEINHYIKSLGNSANYLHTIIDSLQDELLVIDREYHIIEANFALLSRHHMSREDAIGEHCYQIFSSLPGPCLIPLSECPIQAVWNSKKPVKLTHQRDDGEENGQKLYVDVVASPIINENQEVTAVAILMRDVTSTKELEMRVTEAQEYLTALNKVATVVSKTLDLDTVLKDSLEATLEIMQHNTGGIMLLDEESRVMTYRISQGLSPEFVKKLELKPGQGIAGKVVQSGQTILVDSLQEHELTVYRDLIIKEGLRSFASVPLHSKGRVLGVLNIISRRDLKMSTSNVQMLESVAAQIAIAIDNARLHQEVQEKEEMRGELLQDILSIQEEERKRIARELHDETSQVLASLTGNLEAAVGMLPDSEVKAKAIVRKAQALSIEALDETHKLIYELRPTMLDDLGLISATRWLIAHNLEPAGVKVTFRTVGTVRRLSSELETTLFRVTQEAVNNIARHSNAKKANIRLHFKKNLVILQVKDNGIGFDVEGAIRSKERPRGLGLLGMRERVELINGTLAILSNSENGGTEIIIKIPVKQEAKNEQN